MAKSEVACVVPTQIAKAKRDVKNKQKNTLSGFIYCLFLFVVCLLNALGTTHATFA